MKNLIKKIQASGQLKVRRKLKISFVILLFSVFLLFVKVPLSDFIIETSNWKTYRNEEYGFEFKYPSNVVSPHEIENEVCIAVTCIQYAKYKNTYELEAFIKEFHKQNEMYSFFDVRGNFFKKITLINWNIVTLYMKNEYDVGMAGIVHFYREVKFIMKNGNNVYKINTSNIWGNAVLSTFKTF